MEHGGLILAAGLSSRMGAFKPLLPLRGKTVIENTVDSMLAGGAETVVVVLGYRAEEVQAVLSARYDDRVRFACNRRYAETDMLASIRVGLRAMAPCRSFYLLPGDMPLVSPQTYRLLAEAASGDKDHIVFPLLHGRRAHPPLIGSAFSKAILAYDGSDGLRGFWREQEEHIITVPVSDEGCSLDMDTPEQYRLCMEQF